MNISINLTKAESRATAKSINQMANETLIPKERVEYKVKDKAIEYTLVLNQSGESTLNLHVKPFFVEWIAKTLRTMSLSLFGDKEMIMDSLEDIKLIRGESEVIKNGVLQKKEIPKDLIEDDEEEDLPVEDMVLI